ncbi:3644_t:CDS:2, partial [Entrophospora sp. SA101]
FEDFAESFAGLSFGEVDMKETRLFIDTGLQPLPLPLANSKPGICLVPFNSWPFRVLTWFTGTPLICSTGKTAKAPTHMGEQDQRGRDIWPVLSGSARVELSATPQTTIQPTSPTLHNYLVLAWG